MKQYYLTWMRLEAEMWSVCMKNAKSVPARAEYWKSAAARHLEYARRYRDLSKEEK